SSGVEEQVVRCRVGREGEERLCQAVAPFGFGPGAAVLGRDDAATLAQVEIAVRPAEVAPLLHSLELLGDEFVIVAGGESRPALQLLPPMLHRIERLVEWIPGERDRVADPRCPPLRLLERLVRPAGVEAPDAGTGLQLRTG